MRAAAVASPAKAWLNSKGGLPGSHPFRTTEKSHDNIRSRKAPRHR